MLFPCAWQIRENSIWKLRIMCETQTDAINVVGFVDSDYVSDLDRRDLQWILFSHVVMEQLVRDL